MKYLGLFFLIGVFNCLWPLKAHAQEVKNSTVYIYRPCFLYDSTSTVSVSDGDDNNIQDIECGSYVIFNSAPGFQTFYALGDKDLSSFITLDLKPGRVYFVKSDYGWWQYLDIELMKKANFRTIAHLRNVTHDAYTPGYISLMRHFSDYYIWVHSLLYFLDYQSIGLILIEDSKYDDLTNIYNTMSVNTP